MDLLNRIFLHTESLFTFSIVVAATFFVAIQLSKYLQRKINERAKDHDINITNFVFLKHLIVSTVYCLGFGWAFLSLPITHTLAHSLLAGAGATTLILGLASQQLFKNLISGVFLIINKPFQINDTIEFQGSVGKVIEISLNSTIIQDAQGDKIIIPSSLILNEKVKVLSEKGEVEIK